MKQFLTALSFVILAGCQSVATFLSPELETSLRRSAHVSLVTYHEFVQGAMLQYGRLPNCSAEVPKVKLCKDPEIWQKVKAAEAAATESIVAAEATLLGDDLDTQSIIIAMDRIEFAKSLILEAPGGTP